MTAALAAASLPPAVADVVRRALGDPGAAVRGARLLTGGASRETWYLDAVGSDGVAQPQILRRDPVAAAAAAAMGLEAAMLRAARAQGVPEPDVLACSDDPEPLGGPFLLMRFVEGETLARRILRDEEFAAVRPRLAAQCGEILARIHRIDPVGLPALEQVDPVAAMRDALDEFEERSPSFELALRWLDEHRPVRTPPTVVHGDFRNGNLIVGPDGVRAVLDWELVHLGDPMEDLGYICARVWRFGGPGPVGGFGSYADLFTAYERAGGRPVDPARVTWWEIWAALRWGVGCLRLGARHLSGERRSVEGVAIGRRMREPEYDLMLLLEEQYGGVAA